MTSSEKLQDLMIDELKKQVKIKNIKYKDYLPGPVGIPVEVLESKVRNQNSASSIFQKDFIQPDLEFELTDGKKAIGEWFYNNEGDARFWTQFYLWSLKNDFEFWILTNTKMVDVVKKWIGRHDIQPKVFILDIEKG